VTDSAGVSLVPAFAGLGAPYWDAAARGAIVGLTRGSTAAHLAYAALDSIAHQVCDVLEAMRADTGAAATALLADGGASRNAMLMQRQADLAGCAVRCDRSGDVSIRGAAWLAGLAVGFWDSLDALDSLPRETATFQPAISDDDRRAARAGWKDAVSRVRSLR
jgi:glycerol kinase